MSGWDTVDDSEVVNDSSAVALSVNFWYEAAEVFEKFFDFENGFGFVENEQFADLFDSLSHFVDGIVVEIN